MIFNMEPMLVTRDVGADLRKLVRVARMRTLNTNTRGVKKISKVVSTNSSMPQYKLRRFAFYEIAIVANLMRSLRV